MFNRLKPDLRVFSLMGKAAAAVSKACSLEEDDDVWMAAGVPLVSAAASCEAKPLAAWWPWNIPCSPRWSLLPYTMCGCH